MKNIYGINKLMLLVLIFLLLGNNGTEAQSWKDNPNQQSPFSIFPAPGALGLKSGESS